MLVAKFVLKPSSNSDTKISVSTALHQGKQRGDQAIPTLIDPPHPTPRYQPMNFAIQPFSLQGRGDVGCEIRSEAILEFWTQK